MTGERIDLGLAPPVRLGRLTLDPPTRAIRRDDGAVDVVEPRVMQVLLALAEEPGRIVRREELTERCWEGRIVGEDAINRVLSRLRRVAEGVGADSFRIETITKVGYRLIAIGGQDSTAPTPAATPVAIPPSSSATRRAVIAGGTVAGLTAAGGGIAWLKIRSHHVPRAAREAMDRGLNALRIGSIDQLAVAVAAFREAVDAAPYYAPAYGRLALTYRFLYYSAHGEEAMLNAARAREAADKALRLDPDNADAQVTLATLQPIFRNWLAYDGACAPVLARHPNNIGTGVLYITLLADTGRVREVNMLAQRMIAQDAGWPDFHEDLMLSSWCLGRLDDADAAIEGAFKLWPRQIGIWFNRFRLLAYTGRAAQALAMLADVDHRPLGLPAWDFDLCKLEAQALLTRAPADVDAAAKGYWDAARKSVGEAGNAIQFFGAVGRLDDAIALANALYFNRGFDIGVRNFTEEQGTYSERRNRPTWLYWFPFMAPLRADKRLTAIFEEIGLVDYWRKSGHKPDVAVLGVT